MDMLKSNRILKLIFWILLTVFISCREKPKQLFGNGNCGLYVSGKQGFWVDIYSDGLKVNDITFGSGNKKVIPQKHKLTSIILIFFLI
jgi:hypothetical protein